MLITILPASRNWSGTLIQFILSENKFKNKKYIQLHLNIENIMSLFDNPNENYASSIENFNLLRVKITVFNKSI